MPSWIKYFPFYLISLLPIWLLHAIGFLTYILVYHVISYRKKVVQSNLKASFPLSSTTELKTLERKFYRHFCRLFIESLKVLTISKTAAKKRITFHNIDLLDRIHENGQSAVLQAAHFGNWEWFAFFPLSIKHQFVSFYQKQSNSYFNDLSIVMRERFGNICVESRTGYKRMVELQREGTLSLAYMISDQSPTQNSSVFWIDFLNQKTAFLMGADRIGSKLNAPLVYPYVLSKRNGYYDIEFKLIEGETSEEKVKSYARLLEQNIIEQPELWLWTHRRWKMNPPT
ncbi:MAG: lysophospholipid acyltransferase family protein [Bacteroidia bacterium]